MIRSGRAECNKATGASATNRELNQRHEEENECATASLSLLIASKNNKLIE